MPELAAIILTYNEENNIEECIQSINFADDILVIDSGSTDKTRERAVASGARVIIHPMTEDGFAGQRNFAMSQTSADWVFFLDADERVKAETVSAIGDVLLQKKLVAYKIKRFNIVFGKMMHYGTYQSDYPLRFFPRQGVRWGGLVHEYPEMNFPIKVLSGGIDHYTYKTWYQYFVKFNQYTTLAARDMYQRNKCSGCSIILGHSMFSFVRDYFFRKGFMDGFYGFIMAAMSALYTMVKYLKLMNLECMMEQKKDEYKRCV